MNKKSTLESKLLKYSAVAGAVITGGTAEAQLVYFDVNPDMTVTNQTVGIDLNQDAVADFGIIDTNITSANLWLVAGFTVNTAGITQNAIAGSTPAGYDYPFKLNLNDVIDASQPWLTDGGTMNYVVNGAAPYSSFWINGVTDGYLGLRLEVAGNIHYGWIRLDAPADGQSVVIKDMAYNSTPNTAINAGQYNVSVDETLKGKVTIYNSNNILQITMTEVFTNGNLTVTSMNGQVVSNQALNGNTSVDLNSLASGIYVVNIAFEEGVITQKIYISK